YQRQMRLSRAIGDDESSGVLPLVKPFGNLIRTNKAQHLHADDRECNVLDRAADQIGLILLTAAQATDQRDKDSTTKCHVTFSRCLLLRSSNNHYGAAPFCVQQVCVCGCFAKSVACLDKPALPWAL